ncbi:MAG: class I SAM-dependent methyltransferase, partial [Planctomycetota bacterium]
MNLKELMKVHACAKLEHPWYADVYCERFGHIRASTKRVLEIGVQSGGSLRVWADYFPKAEIHGIDINKKCKRYEADRIRVFIGNQEDADFLRQFKGYDIIIDDGGHTMKQQRKSFQVLFPLMADGGTYV